MTCSEFLILFHESTEIEPTNETNFTRIMLRKISPANSSGEVFGYEKSPASTINMYYNGTRTLSRVKLNIDTASFEAFVNDLEDWQMSNLIDAFEKYIPGIDSLNAGLKLSVFFKDTILEEKKRKRKKGTENEKNSHVGDLKKAYGISLLLEAQAKCPIPNCHNALYKNDANGSFESYEILKIDDSKALNEDNCLAICPSCFARFFGRIGSKDVRELYAIKKKLKANYENVICLDSERIDSEIEHVLKSISAADPESLKDISFEPKAVKDKISDDYPLFLEVVSFVTKYYENVDEWFKTIDTQKQKHFTLICNSMSNAYVKLLNLGKNKQDIFDSIVNWLKEQTTGSTTACQIVVSYFIQKCQVF